VSLPTTTTTTTNTNTLYTGSTSPSASASTPAPAVVDLPSPIVSGKAIKNGAELAGMREAHLRDAVALCDFLQWLEAKVGIIN
jgi:Xaa-Pro aminopeptidase